MTTYDMAGNAIDDTSNDNTGSSSLIDTFYNFLDRTAQSASYIADSLGITGNSDNAANSYAQPQQPVPVTVQPVAGLHLDSKTLLYVGLGSLAIIGILLLKK